MPTIEEQLLLHEGLRLKPYRCTSNKLTIGVGRNLEDKGISKEEAMRLLAQVGQRAQRLAEMMGTGEDYEI